MASKTIIVDPNSIDGNDSSFNVPVPLEDLNISVQLETNRKARTVLTATNEAGSAQSTGGVTLRIIEGEKINEQHQLTTNFTDLTTVFDKNDGAQSIGITGIDIDFNSSYVPMVNITFVDLRGSAIFQNEIELSGDNSKNKYSVFFELPYPIFTLTIKGYYGKPVKYCLHMTKWNSRFNSQTGNFEISASFIGYTYAMLSDMLLGYLNAIAFTEEGKAAYKAINDERQALGLKKVLNLSELGISIRTINDLIQKLAANDPNTQVIDSANQKSSFIEAIFTTLQVLGRGLEEDKDGTSESKDNIDTYDYVVVKHVEAPTIKQTNEYSTVAADATSVASSNLNVPNAYTQTVKQPNETNNTTKSSGNPYMDRMLVETNYSNSISENIKEYNALGQPTLDESKFDLTKFKYQDISIDELNPEYTGNTSNLASKLQVGANSTEFDTLRKDIYEYIKAYYPNIADGQKLDIYKLKDIYSYVEEQRKALKDSIEDSTKKLAMEIKNKIGEALGFEPSVRQIVEIFTTAVEVFMEVLYNVSVEAEKDIVRAKELKAAFPNNDNTDIIGVDSSSDKYYAWPDYREDDAVNGYVEKYLGAARGLKNPKNVTELRFIDGLLKAFLDAAKAEANAEAALTDKQSNWLPSNPLDTRIFNSTSPYKRMQCTTPEDVLTLVLIRAMTFLGYSNYSANLNGEEIVAFAQAEANAVINAFSQDKVLIPAIKNMKPEDILKTTNKINNVGRTVVYKYEDTVVNRSVYIYDYVFSQKEPDRYQIIPISSDFKGNWEKTLRNDFNFTQSDFNTLELDLKPTVSGDFPGLINRGVNSIFLSNYSSKKSLSTGNGDGTGLLKVYDGAIYGKIITPSEYNLNVQELVSDVDTSNTVVLSELKKYTINFDSAGFNPFGGAYGIQEFSSLDWGNEKITLPINYMFYDGYLSETDKLFNGLGRDRSLSSEDSLKNFKLTKYDKVYDNGLLRKQTLEIDKDTILELVNGNGNKDSVVLHKDFGKNIDLFNDFKGGDSSITYPYINQRLNIKGCDTTDPDDVHVFSLFGSILYYAQDKSPNPEYAKALLFLNTLPWNGRLFSKYEIINLFRNNASFIHAPRLWCAYIGGLMWRYDATGVDPIQWVSGQTATQDGGLYGQFTYIPTNVTRTSANAPGTSAIPHKDTFFDVLVGECGPSVYDKFGHEQTDTFYSGADDDGSDLIYSLPQQIRNEFKRIFVEFVEGKSSYISWRQIADNLEIWGGSSDAFINYMNSIRSSEVKTLQTSYSLGIFADTQEVVNVDTNNLLSPLINADKYRIITPILNNVSYSNKNLTNSFKYCLFLELDGNYSSNIGVRTLINSLTEECIIANANPEVWNNGHGTGGSTAPVENMYESIFADEEKLNAYIAAFSEVIAGSEVGSLDEKKQQEQELFGTTDENIIKLMLYRTCKNINDKWLAGVTEQGSLLFQCGARNPMDERLKERYRKGGKTHLIDSFRFVNRSFKDIGNELYINPLPLNDYMVNNPNSSFYDIVTSLLSDNNFDFIALPTFVNFRNQEELTDMFRPFPEYEEALSKMEAGPSFVCVYVGQKSKHLDLGSSNYPNDGFDFMDNHGNRSNKIPKDFDADATDYENSVPVFCVNYSQQNQNIFKDIILDQNEFSETAESLQIMDDISQKGSENNRTFGGQNMYNVYSVRSYKAEVEMLGNASIQPMMYFQLNNIPMFHGAYMITRVKHSIKANHMSTNFTGVRIRGPETPLFTAIDLYENLLSSLDLSISSGGNGGINTVGTINSPMFNSSIVPDPTLSSAPWNGFVNPVANPVVTSPINRGGREIHEGIDIGIPLGTNAVAIADGEIELIKFNNGGYGLYIVVNHGVMGEEKKVYKTVYGHMSYIPANILKLTNDSKNLTNSEIDKIVGGYKPGVKVKKGDVIGQTGGVKGAGIYLDPVTKKYNTAGLTTGAHLHFELRVGDEGQLNSGFKDIKYVDPLRYIPLGQDPKYVAMVTKSTQVESASVGRVKTPTNAEREQLFRTNKTWV